jgi:hypothetical protein
VKNKTSRMKYKLLLVFAMTFICHSFLSCVGECYCTKDLGCTILTVKRLGGTSSNPVISTKVICSQTDYRTDYILHDSVKAFQKRYTTDTTYVELKDSIYKYYEPVSVKHNVNRYQDSGYYCNCPR